MSDYHHLSLLTCMHGWNTPSMMSPNLKVSVTSHVSSVMSHDLWCHNFEKTLDSDSSIIGKCYMRFLFIKIVGLFGKNNFLGQVSDCALFFSVANQQEF